MGFSPQTEKEIKKIAREQFVICMLWIVFIPGFIGFLIGMVIN